MVGSTFTCPRCGTEKPKSERSGSGRRICKACWATYMRTRYQRMSTAERQRVSAKVAEYRSSNPEAVLATRLKCHQANPTKANSWRCVEAALAAGVLVRPDRCDGCGCEDSPVRGKSTGLHAHHHDHSKPLEVAWLCPKCHAKADAHKWRRVECPECGRMIVETQMRRHAKVHEKVA